MKVISWQYLLTDHQVFTWQEFQSRGNLVEFILAKTHDENRTKQGWNDTQIETLATKMLPDHGWWKFGRKIINDNQDGVHIFCGFWGDKRFFPLILYALSQNVKTVLMNESYSEIQTGYLNDEAKIKSKLKVFIRPLLYKSAVFLCKLVTKKNALRVLSISPLAKNQFLSAGVPQDNIFPWGYFVPKDESTHRKSTDDSLLNLIFIGNLLPIKGLDLIISAVENINRLHTKPAINLDIFGYGDPKQWIKNNNLGIEYKGIIPFGQSQQVVINYDFLILTSRYDGWGVVLNEALMQGVPVIVSDKVGARVLLDQVNAGIIVKSEDVENLEFHLQEVIDDPEKMKVYAKQASILSIRLKPTEAAVYLQEVLEYTFQGIGPRPIPNWERSFRE